VSDDAWSVYDSMAESYEAHAADSPYNAHYDRPAMLTLLGDVNGKRVLDACCGPGYYIQELLARSASVVGFDASEEMVALATRRTRDDDARVIRAVLGEPLPFADSEFDLVVCPLAIHYVADRSVAFGEFFRVLRPAGAVVLSTQHPTADWLRKGGSYFDVCQEEDVWTRGEVAYTVRFWREPLTSLCSAATNAGFLIERLVEPLPADSMRERWPEDWAKLQREPGFLLIRLLKPPGG
jgi:SAM-dependent methyltransferase